MLEVVRRARFLCVILFHGPPSLACLCCETHELLLFHAVRRAIIVKSAPESVLNGVPDARSGGALVKARYRRVRRLMRMWEAQ